MTNKSPQPIIHISTPHKKINNVCRFNRSPKQYSIPLNKKQEELYDCLNNNDVNPTNSANNIINIIDGPTGTGKTLYAIEHGIKMLMEDKADKMILINAVYRCNEIENTHESIKSLYTNAFTQSLLKHFTYKEIDKMVSDKIIFNVSLNSLTGLTFDNAVVIADNMQFSSIKQMKLLLTRIGYNTKMIICGNNTFSTISGVHEDSNNNGFDDLVNKAMKNNIFNYFSFDTNDIVRNNIISQILILYDTSNNIIDDNISTKNNIDIVLNNTNNISENIVTSIKNINNIDKVHDIFTSVDKVYNCYENIDNDDWICSD